MVMGDGLMLFMATACTGSRVLANASFLYLVCILLMLEYKLKVV